MATPAIAPEKLNKAHYSAFIKYADKNGIKINPENLMVWDAEHNSSTLSNYLEEKFGKEYIYSVGLKEMFKRYLYNYSIFSLEPSKVLPKGLPPTSVIRRGMYLQTANQESLNTLIDQSSQRLKNEARRLSMYKLAPAKIHALVEEALQE